MISKTEMNMQIGRYLEARDDLELYVKKYGRNSGGASDRRRRLKQEQQKLIEMTISYFETGA